MRKRPSPQLSLIFRQDKDGLTRILILERDLTEAQLGALVQRLLEIEKLSRACLLSLPWREPGL